MRVRVCERESVCEKERAREWDSERVRERNHVPSVLSVGFAFPVLHLSLSHSVTSSFSHSLTLSHSLSYTLSLSHSHSLHPHHWTTSVVLFVCVCVKSLEFRVQAGMKLRHASLV